MLGWSIGILTIVYPRNVTMLLYQSHPGKISRIKALEREDFDEKNLSTTGGVTVVPKEFEKLISYNAGVLFWDPMTGIGNLHALNILS